MCASVKCNYMTLYASRDSFPSISHISDISRQFPPIFSSAKGSVHEDRKRIFRYRGHFDKAHYHRRMYSRAKIKLVFNKLIFSFPRIQGCGEKSLSVRERLLTLLAPAFFQRNFHILPHRLTPRLSSRHRKNKKSDTPTFINAFRSSNKLHFHSPIGDITSLLALKIGCVIGASKKH